MNEPERALPRLRRKNMIDLAVMVWHDEWRRSDRDAERRALEDLERIAREQREALE